MRRKRVMNMYLVACKYTVLSSLNDDSIFIVNVEHYLLFILDGKDTQKHHLLLLIFHVRKFFEEEEKRRNLQLMPL